MAGADGCRLVVRFDGQSDNSRQVFGVDLKKVPNIRSPPLQVCDSVYMR